MYTGAMEEIQLFIHVVLLQLHRLVQVHRQAGGTALMNNVMT